MRSTNGLLEEAQQESNLFAFSFLPGLLFVLLLWLIHILAYLTDADLAFLGVYPRNFFGLVGVFLSPLIHADLKHLLSNSFPLVLLSGFILFLNRLQGVRVLLLVFVLSGVFTWFIGRQAYHIGASGVVYGMAGFLLFQGFLTRDRGSLAVAFAVLFLYSGLFYGLFPKEERVSWEGHLAGMVAGLIAAILAGQREHRNRKADNPVVAIQPNVAQQHVSSTFIPYYMQYTIQYSMPTPGKNTQPFTYTLAPDVQPGQKPTKVQYSSSVKKKPALQHDGKTRKQSTGTST